MHQHAWQRALSFPLEDTKLKRSEEFLPRRCSQRLRGGMSVCANDHRSLLDLLWIVRLDDINYIEPPQGRVAVLPPNARTFAFDLRGNRFSELLELVGFSEGLRRKSTENHIRGHSTPPCGHQRSSSSLLAWLYLLDGLGPIVPDRLSRKQWAMGLAVLGKIRQHVKRGKVRSLQED